MCHEHIQELFFLKKVKKTFKNYFSDKFSSILHLGASIENKNYGSGMRHQNIAGKLKIKK